MITFVVDVKPRGQARPRVTRRGTYKIDADVEYEGVIRLAASNAMKGEEPMAGPIRVSMHFACQIPLSYSPKAQSERFNAIHTMKPDIDNMVKSVFDAMNGVVYNDDAQVFSVNAAKSWAYKPSVIVTVSDADND